MEEMEVLEIEIDKDLKEQAEAILREMGLDLETAIVLFIKECVRINGLPFELDDPSLGVKPQVLAKDHPLSK